MVEARNNPAPAGEKSTQPAANVAEDQKIYAKLRKQGVRVRQGTPLDRKSFTVPRDSFEYISSEANWLPELKKLQSHRIKETRLKIHDIQPNSLIKKLKEQKVSASELPINSYKKKLIGVFVEHFFDVL